MKSVPLISAIIFFAFFAAGQADTDQDFLKTAKDDLKHAYGDLVFSAMLFRHGDRGPITTFPTNPHTEYFEASGMRQLTHTGKLRSYNLGRWARQRYAQLINQQPYTPDMLHVMSSGISRTISTAQLFLAGLYPPTSEKEIWNKDIRWQPIPVHSIPKHIDRMILPKEYCARYNYEVERMKNSPEYIEFYKKHQDTIDYIEKHTQLSIRRDDLPLVMSSISPIYDNLYIQEQQGLKHPDWVAQIYPEPIRDIVKMYFRQKTYTYQMKRLKAGPLLGHIINELAEKAKNPDSEKIFQFYSGHDSTIVALLDVLNIWDGSLPYYSASVLLELRKLDQDYILTVSYVDSIEAPPKLLDIPNCPNPCKLENFIKVTKHVIPEDWDAECKQWNPDYNTLLF